MSDKADNLRYRAQPSISMPAHVDLDGDMLRWRIGHLWCDSLEDCDRRDAELVLRQTTGCFDDFIALAKAGPAEVLAFTRARGVLGILPFVSLSWERDSPRDTAFEYWEPVFVYTEMAARFGSIRRVMQSIKNGEEAEESDLRGCCGPDFTPDFTPDFAPDFRGARSSLAYELVCALVSECWRSASTKMTLSGFEVTGQGLDLKNPSEVLMWFGDYRDGYTWDREMGKLARDGGLIAAPLDKQILASGEGPDKILYQQTLLEAGYHKTPSGEWVIPYVHYVMDSGIYSSSVGRPSALYNALAFQLLKEVTFQQETYFCSQCGKPYTYNSEIAGKVDKDSGKRMPPAIGKASKEARVVSADTKTWGNTKPRRDRRTCFCCQFCRMEYDAADNARRRRDRTTGRPTPADLDEALRKLSVLNEGLRAAVGGTRPDGH